MPDVPNAIQEADEIVSAWARDLLAGVAITHLPPRHEVEPDEVQSSVHLYLLDIQDRPSLRGPERAPLQALLRYLVTAADPDPTVAHGRLNRLLFAAMQHPLFNVTLETITPATWQALGVRPQPTFLLCVPVQVALATPPVPLVQEPPTVEGSAMVTLAGRVVGPNDIPLARVRVEYPPLRRSAYSDATGRFTLPGLPASPRTKVLRLLAKGKVFELPVEQPEQAGDVTLIHLDFDQSSP